MSSLSSPLSDAPESPSADRRKRMQARDAKRQQNEQQWENNKRRKRRHRRTPTPSPPQDAEAQEPETARPAVNNNRIDQQGEPVTPANPQTPVLLISSDEEEDEEGLEVTDEEEDNRPFDPNDDEDPRHERFIPGWNRPPKIVFETSFVRLDRTAISGEDEEWEALVDRRIKCHEFAHVSESALLDELLGRKYHTELDSIFYRVDHDVDHHVNSSADGGQMAAWPPI